MSDQPLWDQNLERQIPGLHQAVSNLSTVTHNSGFSVVKVILAPTQQPEDNRVASTRIEFTHAAEQSATVATIAPAGSWVDTQPPGRRLGQLPASSPLRTIQEPVLHRREVPQRPKRSSTSIVNEESEAGSHSEKRKRFSDPSRAMTVGPSGAFWGTVLEESPSNIAESQLERNPIPPPLVGPLQLPTSVPPARLGSEHIRGVTRERVEPDPGPVSRAQRMTTLPALRLRSPPRQRSRPVLPSLQEPLFGASSETIRDRDLSRIEAPSRQTPDRRFFRTASQILGRISPFGAPGPSTTRPAQTSFPVNTEMPFFRIPRFSVQTSYGASQHPGTEFFSEPATGDTLHSQIFPAMRSGPEQQGISAVQQGTIITPQSGSRSASGSGVSYAQASRTSSPPPESRRDFQLGISTRGRRGRRGGASTEREQFFECEHCNSKFRRKSDKNRHVRVVHEKSRPFVCPICEKTFGEKSNMLKHRASVHDDVRIFRCPYCDANFSQRGLCDSHVKTVHDRKQAKYFCEHCGLPFSRKVTLNEHYEQVHPEYRSSLGHYHGGAPSTIPTTRSMGLEIGREFGMGSGDRAFVGDTVQHLSEQEPPIPFPAVTYTSLAPGTTTSQHGLPIPLQQPSTSRFQQIPEGRGRDQDSERDRNG